MVRFSVQILSKDDPFCDLYSKSFLISIKYVYSNGMVKTDAKAVVIVHSQQTLTLPRSQQIILKHQNE